MKLLHFAAALVCLSACNTIADRDRSIKGGLIQLGDGTRIDGGPNYENYSIKVIRLPEELDPEDKGKWKPPKLPERPLPEQEVLARAFRGFYDASYLPKDLTTAPTKPPFPVNSFEFRRNRVQDRIILASNMACDDYKRHLLSTQSVVNYAYGNGIVLSATLGALLKPVSTAQAMSGVAALLSGSRAEYNDAFFRKLLAEVVTRGISEERDTLFNAIQERREQPIQIYTVELAIADVIQYNSKCSLIAGLENTQKAQSFYADPGLKRLAEIYNSDLEDVPAFLSRMLNPLVENAGDGNGPGDSEKGAEESDAAEDGENDVDGAPESNAKKSKLPKGGLNN